jgi:hypothetical protein
MNLYLSVLFLLFFIVSSEYKWKGALLFTLVIGFLQDPIRKLSGVDSSYFGALALIFFLLTFISLKSSSRVWHLNIICWNNPQLLSLLSVFFYLLGMQTLNSFVRFNDIILSVVGVLFYIVPLLSIWVGFHIGCDHNLLRTLMRSYVIICTIFASSMLLSLAGFENSLLKEVGEGIEITGIGYGQSGFWRTSEIAGWHLAAGACFSFILGISEPKGLQQLLYFFLSCGFSFLSITTGRRKALGLIIVFVSLFLLYYIYTSKGSRLTRIIGSIVMVITLLFSSYGLIFSPEMQSNIDPYFDRSSTLTFDESKGRLQQQGFGALLRGIEIAGPFGYGVGAGSNAGSTGIGASRRGIISLAYVSEGGGGRLVVELGVVGLALLIYMVFHIFILYLRNFKYAQHNMASNELLILSGLLIFSIVNIVSFFSASQLYSDPFVLILIGLSTGTFLAVPILCSKQKTLIN